MGNHCSCVESSAKRKRKKKKKEASFPIDSSLLFFSVRAALLNPSSTLAPWFLLGCCYAGMAKQTIRKLDLKGFSPGDAFPHAPLPPSASWPTGSYDVCFWKFLFRSFIWETFHWQSSYRKKRRILNSQLLGKKKNKIQKLFLHILCSPLWTSSSSFPDVSPPLPSSVLSVLPLASSSSSSSPSPPPFACVSVFKKKKMRPCRCVHTFFRCLRRTDDKCSYRMTTTEIKKNKNWFRSSRVSLSPPCVFHSYEEIWNTNVWYSHSHIGPCINITSAPRIKHRFSSGVNYSSNKLRF